MHWLLERQIARARRGQPDGSLDVNRLLEMVSTTYEDADRDRRLGDRAVALVQEELEALNGRIKEDAEAECTVLMDNVGEAVIMIDERGLIEGFNRAAERIFGYTVAEVHGRNVTILMTDEYAVQHDKKLVQYVQTGVATIIGRGREVVARRKNGEVFPIELAVGEVLRSHRRRFIGVIRDISERKRIEHKLRQSEKRFRDYAAAASDWLWETDPDHRFRYVSDRIESALGIKVSEIVGRTMEELGLFDEAPDAAVRYRVDVTNRQPFRGLTLHVGARRPELGRTIRLGGVPVFDAAGEFIGYRGVGADITREMQAERRAAHAQRQLADAIESMVDAVAVYDDESRLVICNSGYRNAVGPWSDVAVPGTAFESILRAIYAPNGDDISNHSGEEYLRYRLARHSEASGEAFIFKFVNGHWYQARECRMRDGGVVSIRTDITELKRREEEVESLRRRYSQLLDAAGEGIMGLDSDGRITFANPMATQILGYPAEELVDRSFHDIVQLCRGDGSPYLREDSPVRHAYRFGSPGQVSDEVFCPKGGKCLPVEYFVTPTLENTKIVGAVIVFRDITLRRQYEDMRANLHRQLEEQVVERTRALSLEVLERIKTESALRASQERLTRITDSLFEGVLVVDDDGRVVFTNRSARNFLANGDVGKCAGARLDDLFRLEKRGRGVSFAASPFRLVMGGGDTVHDDDAHFLTDDGRPLNVAYTCSPLCDDANARSAIISFRDIETLKQAQREALQSSRLAAVGQLAAGIAHEINTPAQYVSDNLQFLGDSLVGLMKVIETGNALSAGARGHALLAEPVDRYRAASEEAEVDYLLEEMPKAVGQSLDGMRQISRIVLSMKEFSHPGTGTKSAININQALQTTLTVSRNAWKQVAEVVTDFDMELPLVSCYPGEMNQVFLNLVVNAAHAIEGAGKPLPGRVTVSTRKVGGQVEIRIEDTGTGIPEAIRDKIFDPFFTTKDVGKGTGQGLAICRDVVVTKHGGRLVVGGEDGVGAIFTVCLPIEDSVGNDG